MPDIRRVKQFIQSPATLKVGAVSATEIAEMLVGQVSITFGSQATNVGSSASAAVSNLTTNHKVICIPNGTAGLGVAGAACLADGVLTVTGLNMSAGTINEGAQNFNFFAFKT